MFCKMYFPFIGMKLQTVYFRVCFWLCINTVLQHGGFIWSHILKTDIPQFLKKLQNQLTTNGELIFIDNKYVEGSSTPISRTDEDGNTYQIRRLQNGDTYEVLKNFPSKEEVDRLIKDLPLEMTWTELEYYWVMELKKST